MRPELRAVTSELPEPPYPADTCLSPPSRSEPVSLAVAMGASREEAEREIDKAIFMGLLRPEDFRQ